MHLEVGLSALPHLEAFWRPSPGRKPAGMLQPEAIGSAIAFLAGPEARFVSGATLDVNAGRSARLTA